MLRKILAYLPVLSLVFCLFSVRALAGDECSSTNSTAKNSTAQNVQGACVSGRETRKTTAAGPKVSGPSRTLRYTPSLVPQRPAVVRAILLG